DRTNIFARRGFAMLAKHRLRYHLRLIDPGLELLLRVQVESLEKVFFAGAAGVITIDSQPMHLASAIHLILADDRDIVFALASHHASRATDTEVQIDRHPPLVPASLL